MKRVLFLSIVLLIVLNSCETNPPTKTENDVQGIVRVTANVDSAKIFVDNIETEFVTPADLNLPAGQHEIKVEKENYNPVTKTVDVIAYAYTEVDFVLEAVGLQRIVLIEDFANVSCNPCVVSNRIIHGLVNDRYGTDKVVALKYHVNFPAPNDPFYLANPTEANKRREYYNVISAPSVFVDGVLNPIATDSNEIKNNIEERLNASPLAIINVSDSISGATIFAKGSVELTGINQAQLSNYKLFIALTETDIEFANPPGSNGETIFYDVMRKMLPNADGIDLSALTSGSTFNFSYSASINSGWNASNLSVIVFIQNINTKEVIQASSNH